MNTSEEHPISARVSSVRRPVSLRSEFGPLLVEPPTQIMGQTCPGGLR